MLHKIMEVLLKVLDHFLVFLEVHKFALGPKKTLCPLVHKEKCTMLDEAIELAIVSEDGKKFAVVGGQRSSWTRVSREYVPPISTLPSISDGRGKDTRAFHVIKTTKGTKRKVSTMGK